MKLTIKDKALIRCRVDNNIEKDCSDCEIYKECDWGGNYNDLSNELLNKLGINWEKGIINND